MATAPPSSARLAAQNQAMLRKTSEEAKAYAPIQPDSAYQKEFLDRQEAASDRSLNTQLAAAAKFQDTNTLRARGEKDADAARSFFQGQTALNQSRNSGFNPGGYNPTGSVSLGGGGAPAAPQVDLDSRNFDRRLQLEDRQDARNNAYRSAAAQNNALSLQAQVQAQDRVARQKLAETSALAGLFSGAYGQGSYEYRFW